jgi:hypothetical protein
MMSQADEQWMQEVFDQLFAGKSIEDITLHSQSSIAVYNELSHPASTSISNKHAWCTADGSNNDIDMTDLGKVVKTS